MAMRPTPERAKEMADAIAEAEEDEWAEEDRPYVRPKRPVATEPTDESGIMKTKDVIPAYLGWGNPERDKVSLRLYATDLDDAPRWDRNFEGGRVVEYAAVERFGQAEGNRFLVVRVGDRFTTDETMQRLTEAVLAALAAEGD